MARDTLGWPDEAPYDAIMVTAAAPRLPESLLDQLKKDGRMIIPVGSYTQQELYYVTKQKNRNKIEKMGGCRFVPLIAKDAWTEEWSYV